MKKLFIIMITAVISFAGLQTRAQAFDQTTKTLGIGIGAAELLHFPVGGYWYGSGPYIPVTGEGYFHGEFGVQKYIGVGFDLMLGGRAGTIGYAEGIYGYGGIYSGYRSEINISADGFANFHFYQLIADKTGKNIYADKLDIYVGLTLGGGVAFHPADAVYNHLNRDRMLIVGPQVGINYFFVPAIGVNAEVGYGKTVFCAGIVFKLGTGKKSN